MKNVAKRLQEAYRNSGLTIMELSKKTGIPSSCVHRYVVTGETEKIPITRLQALAVALDVTPEHILGWEEKESAPDQVQLTEGEKAMLDLFNRVPVDQQQLVLQMIRAALGSQE